MATTTIADYQILQDTSFTLFGSGNPGSPNPTPPGSTNKQMTFDVPTDLFVSDNRGRGGILSFKMRPRLDSDLRVTFGAAELLRTTFDASHTRAYHECFLMRETLFAGEPESRELILSFQCFSGEIRISDVVIWYQIKR